MSHETLGKLPNGREIREAVLATSAGLEAHVMEFGATLRDLIIPVGGAKQHVVLGFDGLDAYAQGFAHHAGAIAGRYANRIAHGSFALEGKTYELERNEANRHALHGGSKGFGKRPWTLVDSSARAATFALVSADGDEGYPGTLRLWCRYEAIEPATLALELSATADAATVVNLANHSYFNLDGSDDVRDHEFTIAADFYTPTDRELIPTGEIAEVAGTPYDFTSPRPIRLVPPGASSPVGYDTNFVLRRSRIEMVAGLELAYAATLSSRKNGVRLELFTSEPGLQVFDCHGMEFKTPGHDGRHYGFGAGLALEAQHFPDGPNRAHFPSTLLRPGEIYRQRTEFRFTLTD